MNTEEDLVRVAEFEDQSEARFAVAALQAAGIDAKLHGDEVSALGLSLEGPDLIEIIVTRGDYEKSKKILEELEEAEPDVIPAWTCKCGEEVDEGFGICWSCQTEYKASE